MRVENILGIFQPNLFSFLAVFQGFEDIFLVVEQVILTRQKGEVYRGSMKKPVLATLEDHWRLKSMDFWTHKTHAILTGLDQP
jgi:hypothetical protein